MRVSITNASSVTQQTFRVQSCEYPSCDPRIAFFDRHAPGWDANAGEVAQTLQRLEALRDRLGLRAGLEVLEAGCGTGRITKWLATTVTPGRVVAADFSPAMLAQARTRHPDGEFWLLDVCAEAPAENLFDVALCFNAFPHFRDQPLALRNFRYMLKPGGRLLILHLAGSAKLNHFHSGLAHPVCHDLLPAPEAWPDLLAAAGLRLQSFTDEADLFLLEAIALKPGA